MEAPEVDVQQDRSLGRMTKARADGGHLSVYLQPLVRLRRARPSAPDLCPPQQHQARGAQRGVHVPRNGAGREPSLPRDSGGAAAGLHDPRPAKGYGECRLDHPSVLGRLHVTRGRPVDERRSAGGHVCLT